MVSGLLCRLTDNRGFTLIEGIVSVVLLSITAVGVFNTVIISQRFVTDARHVTEATNFARKKLERIIDTDFKKITQIYTTGISYDANLFDQHSMGLTPDPDNDSVSNYPNSLPNAEWKVQYTGTDPLTIKVIVSWRENRENVRDRKISLSTRITESR